LNACRDKLLNNTDVLTLNPNIEGVFLRYPKEPFENTSVGNPYPYGIDPVCCIVKNWRKCNLSFLFQSYFNFSKICFRREPKTC